MAAARLSTPVGDPRPRAQGSSEVLDDLRVVLTQFSPGVRSALMANLLSSGGRSTPDACRLERLAITGHEVKLCSAAALGRLHALADDAPVGRVSRSGRRSSGGGPRP